MNSLISILSAASDKYGSPYLLGFMEHYNLSGLIDATEEQAAEYIEIVGISKDGQRGAAECLLSSTKTATAR